MSKEHEVIETLLASLSRVTAKANGLAIPVSGGSDGALCFWLFNQAYPKKTRGIHFGTALRSAEWFHQHGRIDYLEAPPAGIEAEALRWAGTANYCLHENCWPVGSRNRSEEILRTYSRPSIIATILPIVGVWKSDVMRLCTYIGVPEEVIASSRHADPACGRPQEMADIGIERIDVYLKVHSELLPKEDLEVLTEPERDYLAALIALNEFKAGLPHGGPNVEIST